jgi:cytochrome c-type biogenesis protein CcmE
MKSAKLPAVLVAVSVAGVLAFLSFGSMEDNLVYYWSPTELRSASTAAPTGMVRLGGLVKAGSVRVEGTNTLFTVEDNGASVQVRTAAIPPQMFREGIGVVVEGSLGPDGVFESKRLLVKHDENYVAPTDGALSEGQTGSLKAD